ncbi:hypothetical protein EH230_08045 [Flavobacterium columnare]|uniref:Uncharacterized protein n=1 Tax=Flavobacterium columnare TaxID=996 RepID=A0A437UB34_9FLAO|nr:hypothetical protein [Flavobacterium columnare]RVU90823.1 hypothetical protein EH230_07880 [Flavobacterium columnare]RVU90842.1 hypothetical protein EH230_07975 [Flavobacterium columnare]RVU90856.1 hypothetical protein EH230_08045 [Flavobacterium columnare]
MYKKISIYNVFRDLEKENERIIFASEIIEDNIELNNIFLPQYETLIVFDAIFNETYNELNLIVELDEIKKTNLKLNDFIDRDFIIFYSESQTVLLLPMAPLQLLKQF